MTVRLHAPLFRSGTLHRRRRLGPLASRLVATSLVAASLGAASLGTGTSVQASASYPQLIWSDEFSGASGSLPDPAKWGRETGAGGWGNHELQSYTDREKNASLDGRGHLAITPRRETYTGPDGVTAAYTSARLNSYPTFSFTFGRVEARIKVSAGQGLWPAFWMLGTDVYTAGWPWSGEIDVMETVNDAMMMSTNVHGPNPTEQIVWQHQRLIPAEVTFAAEYHVYAVEWSSEAIWFTIDGVAAGGGLRSDLPEENLWVFDKPFFLLLNVAVGGDGPGIAPTPTSPVASPMRVDYVRVYQ